MNNTFKIILTIISFVFILTNSFAEIALDNKNAEKLEAEIRMTEYQFLEKGNRDVEENLFEYFELEKELKQFTRENRGLYNSRNPEDRKIIENAKSLNIYVAITLANCASKSPKLRRMFLEEYKIETEGSELSYYRNSYLRSSADFMEAVSEVWGMHNGEYDFRIIEEILFQLNNDYDNENPAFIPRGEIIMNEKYFDMLSNFILDINNKYKPYKVHAFRILLSPKLTLKFSETSKVVYDKKLFNLFCQYLPLSYTKLQGGNGNYFFGYNDTKDDVYLSPYHLWYRMVYKILPKSSAFTLENVKNLNFEKESFENTTKLIMLAELGEKSAKNELKEKILREENPILKTYLLKAFAKIANKDDVSFLEPFLKDERSYKFPEMYRPTFEGNKYEFREEIFPVREETERILKNIVSNK